MIIYPELLFGQLETSPTYDPTAHQMTTLGICIAFFAGTISSSTKLFVTENAGHLKAIHINLWVGFSIICIGTTTNLMIGHFAWPQVHEIPWVC